MARLTRPRTGPASDGGTIAPRPAEPVDVLEPARNWHRVACPQCGAPPAGACSTRPYLKSDKPQSRAYVTDGTPRAPHKARLALVRPVIMPVRMGADELATLDRVAAAAELPTSTWVRRAALSVARKALCTYPGCTELAASRSAREPIGPAPDAARCEAHR